jgi:hypothetical protein
MQSARERLNALGVLTCGTDGRRRGGGRRLQTEARVGKQLQGRREAIKGRGRARRGNGCCACAESSGDSRRRRTGGGRSGGGQAGLGFSRGGRNAPEGERRGRRGRGHRVASPHGHTGPASGRRRGDAATAGQPATPGCVTRGERGADGWAWVRKEIKKISDSNSKFKISYFPSSKNHQKFTEARINHQEHNATTKTQKKTIKYCL